MSADGISGAGKPDVPVTAPDQGSNAGAAVGQGKDTGTAAGQGKEVSAVRAKGQDDALPRRPATELNRHDYAAAILAGTPGRPHEASGTSAAPDHQQAGKAVQTPPEHGGPGKDVGITADTKGQDHTHQPSTELNRHDHAEAMLAGTPGRPREAHGASAAAPNHHAQDRHGHPAGQSAHPPENLKPLQASTSNEKTGHTDPPVARKGNEGDTGGGDGGGPNGPKPPDDPNGGGDNPPSPKGPDGNTDKNVEKIKGLEETIGRQDKTIAQQARLIDGQNKTIARQDARIGKLEDDNDKLRARVAELESRDQSGGTSVDEAPNVISRQDKTAARPAPDRPWYKKLPGTDTIAVGASAVTLGEAIAVDTHHLSSPTEAIIAGGITLGVTGYTVAKNKIGKYWEKKHADRPQN